MRVQKKSITATVLTFLFLIGVFLTVLEINIYRNTLIVWTIPTAIWIFSGVLATPFTLTLLKKHFDDSGIILQILFNIGAFGGIVLYLFMALNFYIPFSKENIYRLKIINTGSLAKGRNGCGSPYAEVKVKDVDKQLIFPCDTDVESYSEVVLTVKSGLLGFDIITKKVLSSGL